MLAHPFSSGCRFRKTLLGVPSDHRIFRKGFCFCLCRGGQHFPFHLIARYHNRAGRPTDIGSAISGSGATDGIAAFVFLCFPGFWRTGPFSGFVVAVIVRGPDATPLPAGRDRMFPGLCSRCLRDVRSRRQPASRASADLFPGYSRDTRLRSGRFDDISLQFDFDGFRTGTLCLISEFLCHSKELGCKYTNKWIFSASDVSACVFPCVPGIHGFAYSNPSLFS